MSETQKTSIMPLKPKLTINDIDVTDLILGNLSWHYSENEPSRLETTLKLDWLLLGTLDLRGRIVLEFADGDEVHRHFSGYVIEGFAEQTQYTIHCKDPSQILQEAKTNGSFGKGMLPGEIIYYLLADVMPESTDKNLIASGQGSLTLGACGWLFQKSKFMFIAPCPSCKLSESSIDFGDITLYVVDGRGNFDDQIINTSLTNSLPDEWGDGKSRVMFYVQADGFLDAFEKGRKQLRKFMDYLSFGAHFSTPSYRVQDEVRFHTYHRERAQTDFSYPQWAYVRDLVLTEEPRYWLRWYAPHRLGEQFIIVADDPLVRLYPLFAELLEDEEHLTTKQRTLLNAMHALRNARQTENTLDGISFIWQCIEYLAAGYSIPKVFTDNDRKALKRVAKCLMDKRYKDGTQQEKQQRHERIDKGIGELEKPHLRGKWEIFCMEHSISYSEADIKFLWRTRDIRNDMIHGRSAAIVRQDVERAAVMLEKAVVSAIGALRHPIST